jgi:hypothetical protein
LLQDESQLSEVVITGSKTKFLKWRTGAETTIGRKELLLPTISRSAEDFTRLDLC